MTHCRSANSIADDLRWYKSTIAQEPDGGVLTTVINFLEEHKDAFDRTGRLIMDNARLIEQNKELESMLARLVADFPTDLRQYSYTYEVAKGLLARDRPKPKFKLGQHVYVHDEHIVVKIADRVYEPNEAGYSYDCRNLGDYEEGWYTDEELEEVPAEEIILEDIDQEV